MQGKYVSGEQKFSSFVLRLILKLGGTRMQMVTGDITKEMQHLDAKDDINLHRKRYGNMDQCLKDIKHPFFIIDSMVIKMKPYEEIESMHKQGYISQPDFVIYQQVYQENVQKNIAVLKINNLNECVHCSQQYKININNEGACPATSSKHVGKHTY